MQLTKEQLYNYIKEHGITKAELTEDFNRMPKGTILYFGIYQKYLSTYDSDTNNKNESFVYDFDYCWSDAWKNYKGKFKIIQEVATDKSKIIAQIKKKNKELNKLIEML